MIKKIRNLCICFAISPVAFLIVWTMLGEIGSLNSIHIEETMMEMISTLGIVVTVTSATGAVIAQKRMHRMEAYEFERK
ncbi:hypothetical protein [Puniceicoccus vermicola]|uniref:Uncharacterized protein n=1 Tax=Puniceicoccus vermicola TaxID=388746 RepID=A0A7X1E6Q7_9BACT|nr:hypothetical protein [Puniceicoccus vermicola]MBC2604338.1 hypothetical protein [Puniceicoccus vermicola]